MSSTPPPLSPLARAHRLIRPVATSLCPLLGIAVALAFSPSLAAAEMCPNAVFRTGASAGLPDCRAFEQVTPEFKNGAPAGSLVTLAPSGESLVVNSVVTLLTGAGTGDNGPSGADYSISRVGGGWVTTSVMPQAKEFDVPSQEALEVTQEGSTYLAYTGPNGRSTLWHTRRVGTPEGDSDLYLESSPGAALVDVGPMRRLSGGVLEVAGASNELSHVLLTGHWPIEGAGGGIEEISSLFEYVGIGATVPLLVGVGEDGQLISKCGTDLGSISDDGSRVVFTAHVCGSAPAVSEVYVRVDNGLPGAHTIAVSEPVPGDCSACETAAGARRSATFVGASEDGSKVFFETEQPLLAGATGRNIYEYDFDRPAGERVVLVSGGDATVSSPVAGVQRVLALPADGSHVYFLASGVLTETPNSQGQTAVQGAGNMYVFDTATGQTAFITDGGLGGRLDVTSDGRFLVFEGEALTPDSTGEGVFEYDASIGSLVRVSIGAHGYNDNGNLATATIGLRSVAADGTVFFLSTAALTPMGGAGIYEYRAGQVYWIAAGNQLALIGTDASGDDVFFYTDEGLAPTDLNEGEDIYDARVDGGFASYLAAPECSGDECQGPLSAAPVLLSPGSQFQAGGGNFKQAAPVAVSEAGPKAKKKTKKAKKMKKAKKAKKKGGGRGNGRKARKSNGRSKRGRK